MHQRRSWSVMSGIYNPQPTEPIVPNHSTYFSCCRQRTILSVLCYLVGWPVVSYGGVPTCKRHGTLSIWDIGARNGLCTRSLWVLHICDSVQVTSSKIFTTGYPSLVCPDRSSRLLLTDRTTRIAGCLTQYISAWPSKCCTITVSHHTAIPLPFTI